MSAERIWLHSQEITSNLIGQDFSEYLETSVKGTGFFEWEVKALRFRAIDVSPSIGQQVRVTIDGQQELLGTVSAIEDAYTNTPLIEALPFGGVLKDVKAGVEESDDAGRLRWVFELAEDTSIQTALETLLARFNANKPVHIAGATWTVSVPGSQADILGVFAPYGLTTRTGESGTGYPGSSPAQYLAAGLPAPGYSVSVQVRDTGSELRLGLRVLGEDTGGSPLSTVAYYSLPYAGPPANNRITQGGTMSPAAWEALTLLNGSTSADVAAGQVIAYVNRLTGYTDLEFVTAIQQTTGVWTVVKRRDQDQRPIAFLVWWGDPRTQTIRGRWYNKSMADLVKLFTLVSGRWLKFDGTAITLPLRDSDVGEVSLPDPGLALSYDQQDVQQSTPEAQIVAQPNTGENLDEAEGLGGWTDSRTTALNWYYNDRFSGVLRTTTAEYIADELPAGLQLLSRVPGVGHVVGRDITMDGFRVRLKMIQEATA